ncbi:uncharacterized protein DS421_6g178760 [Arachis hypogaea]|nr:uncharacterized protein DS421_6g178760 [Arachis hypogaea]
MRTLVVLMMELLWIIVFLDVEPHDSVGGMVVDGLEVQDHPLRMTVLSTLLVRMLGVWTQGWISPPRCRG